MEGAMPAQGRVPKPVYHDALETLASRLGNRYFHISDQAMSCDSTGFADHTIDLKELVDEVRQRGVGCHCPARHLRSR
jgi:hypothetical protein